MNSRRIAEQAQTLVPSGAKVSIERVSGGDSHQSFRVEDEDGNEFFLKANTSEVSGCLESEYQSLSELLRLGRQNYPAPLAFKNSQGMALLLMTFQHYTSLTEASAAKLGRALAAQHRVKGDDFGWHADNHIGLTPQSNTRSPSWLEFYRDQRLRPQLRWAIDRGLSAHLITGVERLAENLENYLDDSVTPSLLHGDLWSGNVAYDLGKQAAALFDPAPYFGDREADIAITRLFGSFPASFYESYNREYALNHGYQDRQCIYNLYHALNHFNLFGAAYEDMVSKCLPT